jgi:hypothetical protein
VTEDENLERRDRDGDVRRVEQTMCHRLHGGEKRSRAIKRVEEDEM